MTEENRQKLQNTVIGKVTLVYLVLQLGLVVAWIVPGGSLNDTPWGLVFMPTWFYLAAWLGVIGLALFILIIGLALVASEDAKETKEVDNGNL